MSLSISIFDVEGTVANYFILFLSLKLYDTLGWWRFNLQSPVTYVVVILTSVIKERRK